MNLKEETLLQNGKFKILKILGQGGFGTTYLAVNIMLDKVVALKEFFPKGLLNRETSNQLTIASQNNKVMVEKLKARFLKEAQNIAKLDHPGVIRIHDIFEENGTAYYVMDFIEGETLSEIIKNKGPLNVEAAKDIILKVGEPLHYVHSQNMTHFDIKPANIMIRKSDKKPVLIDFGLSKQYDDHGDATSSVLNAVSHGYSPFELYQTGTLQTFSPQTDVYSLGATLFYLITGNTPPDASSLIESGLVIPSVVPAVYQDIIWKAMNIKRKERYQSVGEFCDALISINDAGNPMPEEAEIPEIAEVEINADTPNNMTDSDSSGDNLGMPAEEPPKNNTYSYVVFFLIILFVVIALIYLTTKLKGFL